MRGCLEFLQAVYKVFGFTFKLNLSTRPDKFIGDVETWNKAEKVDLERTIFVNELKQILL